MLDRPEELLAYIASDNSKLFKEETIRAAAIDGRDEFFQGLRLALDPMDTFGVKKIPERSGPDGKGVSMEDFVSLCEQLINRDLTGGDAQIQIEMLMRASTNAQWNGWYRRILMKDLKAGFSESTINKAVKSYDQYIIPVFSCQLAHDSKDHEDKLVGKKFVDVKLDGARCLTFVNPDGRVFQTSRNGKELTNFPKIVSQFASIAEHFPEPMVIDGEMMSASFQDLMKQFKRKTNVQTDDAIYYVFDMLPLSEFRAGKSKKKQAERTANVQQLFEAYGDYLPNAQPVGLDLLDLSTEAGKKRFEEINRAAIDGGYEGIMIKNPDGYYQTKRSYDWMKKKPTITLTMEIIGVEEGKPDSKYKGMLGALVGKCTDNGRIIVVSCGGGFSDKQREDLWKVRDQLLGCLMEVEADAITQNSNGEYSLRFPRFKTFRGHVPGEQI